MDTSLDGSSTAVNDKVKDGVGKDAAASKTGGASSLADIDDVTSNAGGAPPNSGSAAATVGAAGQNTNSLYVKDLPKLCAELDDSRAHRMVLRPGSHVSKSTVISLRCRALELVGAVFLADGWTSERKTVVDQFIRALLSPHEEVVAVACAGLKLLREKTNMPNELLPAASRPLLEQMSDYSKLSVPVLKSISRLLDILPIAAFNQTFADKLLEYLGLWLNVILDPIAAAQQASHAARSADAIKIACAIIDVFCFTF